MPTVHGYVLGSLDDTRDGGASLAHCEECYAAVAKVLPCEAAGLQVEAVVQAKKPFRSRPIGLRLSNELAPGDVVVIPLAYRAFRGLKDLTQTVSGWQGRGVRCIVMDMGIDTQSPRGCDRLEFAQQCAIFASRSSGEATKQRIASGRSRGKFHGRPPFGLRVKGPKGNRHYEIQPDFAVGKMIVSWKLAGHTWDAIRLHLRANRIFRPALPGDPIEWKRTGRPWTKDTIIHAYKGTIRLMNWIARGKIKDTTEEASDGPGQGVPGPPK